MRAYKDVSHLYEGMEKSFIFIEGKSSHALNRLVARYQKRIEEHIKFHGIKIGRFNIIGTDESNERSVRNLVLRKWPTLNEEELLKKMEQVSQEGMNGKLLFIDRVTPNGNGEFKAWILCEDEWPARRGYLLQLLKFLVYIIDYCKAQKPLCCDDHYKLIPKEKASSDIYDENNEWLCNDMLADSVCSDADNTLSPIRFDNDFNILLPLYPQINIKLDPLPKSLYILFLNHPEGILLKNIQDYETELKNIYRAVSGRKNPTVINRMFNSIVDPTENPLHKNISMIRRSFMSQLSYDIARNYIPPHSRNCVHNIPLDNSLVEIPNEVFETCC